MKPFFWRGAWLSVFFRGSVKIELKQAQPNFTEYNYIRQLRNAFVYSLGLFTQLSIKKKQALSIYSTKSTHRINFAKKASTFVIFLICSNETVFLGGEGLAFCIFCGIVKNEMKQAKPNFTEYNLI